MIWWLDSNVEVVGHISHDSVQFESHCLTLSLHCDLWVWEFWWVQDDGMIPEEPVREEMRNKNQTCEVLLT